MKESLFKLQANLFKELFCALRDFKPVFTDYHRLSYLCVLYHCQLTELTISHDNGIKRRALCCMAILNCVVGIQVLLANRHCIPGQYTLHAGISALTVVALVFVYKYFQAKRSQDLTYQAIQVMLNKLDEVFTRVKTTDAESDEWLARHVHDELIALGDLRP